MLKNGKFTPIRLLQHFELDDRKLTKGLGVDRVLKEAVEGLSEKQQKILVSLSVFQSSTFSMTGACEVINENGTDLIEILQHLYDCHLVEYFQERNENDFKSLSLHPLVFQYLKEWKKPQKLQETFNEALQRFINLYEKTNNRIVENLETNYFKGWKILDNHRVHIMKFYDVMADHAEDLPPHPKKSDLSKLILKKRVADLADILLSNVKMRRMFQVTLVLDFTFFTSIYSLEGNERTFEA